MVLTWNYLLRVGSRLHRRVPGTAFFLYCKDDRKCVLTQQGDKTVHEFTDILEAVSFISRLDADRSATLTVYDAFGNVTFQDLLSLHR